MEHELPARPPFDLELTVRALQRTPANLVDRWENGRYLRVLPLGRGNRLLSVRQTGTAEQPRVAIAALDGALTAPEGAIATGTLQRMLALDLDITPFYHLADTDPRLAVAVQALVGMKPPRFPTLFESIINSVLFQQISLHAALAITGRLIQRYGEPLVVAGETYYAAPTAEAVAVADPAALRALGLSTRKAEVLPLLARAVVDGALASEALQGLPSEEALTALDAWPGIGRWTAQIILLRGFGRMDVFPGGDSGARRSMARLLGVESPLNAQQEADFVARFGPYKGYLYFYALGWRLIHAGIIQSRAGRPTRA